MDEIDRKICEVVQSNGRISAAALADAVGAPASTVNDRLRRLDASGAVRAWRAVLEPARVGAGLCAFILVDMIHDGEAAAAAALVASAEVLELHHISGAHSYLVKIRVADMDGVQRFLSDVVKPLTAVQRTETLFAMETLKETSEVRVAAPAKTAPA